MRLTCRAYEGYTVDGRNDAMLDPLTDKQAAILEFITDEMASKKRPPSVREIAGRFRLGSPTSVRDHLAALERKGYIERLAGEKRCIQLTPEYEQKLGLPIIGDVAVGTPILAEGNIKDHLHLDELFPREGKHFCLQVSGESMVDEGIRNGDYVVVRRKDTFENGEIGVAVIGGDCIVRRLRREEGKVRLIPASEEAEEIEFDLAEQPFHYGGEVVGVVRLLNAR
jgi:repressor LexA